MFRDPLLHLDSQPKGIDAECHDAKQPPLDVTSKETAAGPIETSLPAVNDRVIGHPLLPYADGPGPQ